MFKIKRFEIILFLSAVVVFIASFGTLTYRTFAIDYSQQRISPSNPDHLSTRYYPPPRGTNLCTVIAVDFIICHGQTNAYTNVFQVEHTQHRVYPFVSTNVIR